MEIKLIKKMQKWFHEQSLLQRQHLALISGVEPRRKKRKYTKECFHCGGENNNKDYSCQQCKEDLSTQLNKDVNK